MVGRNRGEEEEEPELTSGGIKIGICGVARSSPVFVLVRKVETDHVMEKSWKIIELQPPSQALPRSPILPVSLRKQRHNV